MVRKPAPGAESAGDPYFPALGNGGYDIAGYDLKLGYDPRSGRLDGVATITATATQPLSRLSLDLHRLTVEKVTVDGRDAGSSTAAGKLAITPPAAVAQGSRFTVAVRYGGVPAATREAGWHRSGSQAYAAGGASAWFPANDHPADKAAFALEMTVPSRMSAVSNGIPGRRTTTAGRTTWRWRQTEPMATYLAFVAIGDYRVTSTTHGGKPMITAVPRNMPPGGRADQALERTGEIADWFEQKFGPYPFSAYGGVVVDDPEFSAAQTRPVYGGQLLSGEPRDNAAEIARALAQQWFGGSVSIERWPDSWLSEGFARYAQWMWIEQDGGPAVEESVREQYENYPWQVMPAADPGADEVFSSGPQDRGAMTLHALRGRIGEGPFFALLRKWAGDHAYGNASTGDFIAAAERMSGQNLRKFFDVWLSGTYRPTY
ncbi:M1 family metallopeptidase [Actinoplanes sp. NPDC051494]|uniref:M1 family metallopeptidase n=1 Tax=Actinoplanes sp. NPDC051494 TaxID=3363907 RepID=UPI00379A7590